MGYTTEFKGSIKFDREIDSKLVKYINDFSHSRRMKRNVDKIKEIYPNWKDKCFNGELGVEGEYFIITENYGQIMDESIINYNEQPKTQPGLWCQWIIKDNELQWDGAEKFYSYVEWLRYIIQNFLSDYIANGEIEWQGEDDSDKGVIIVKNNLIKTKYN